MTDLTGWKLPLGGLLVVIAITLCIPLHLYPLPNYIEELWVVVGVVAFAACAFWRANDLRFSVWSLAWLVLGGVFLISAGLHSSAFASGAIFYLVFWFVGALALLISDQVDWSDVRASLMLAWILLGGALVCAVGGALRHYGLLWGGVNAFVPMVDTGRMVGMIGHSNFFAYVCLLGILAAGWLFQVRRISLGWLVPLYLVLALCLVFSGSRSALVAWAGLVCFLVLLRNRLMVDRYVAFVAVGLFGLVVLQPLGGLINQWLLENVQHAAVVDDRLFALGGRGADSSGRIDEWKIAWQLFLEHFWLGIGAGGYASASFAKHIALGLPSPAGVFTHCHNSPLQLAVEFGIAGVVWMVGLLWLLVRGFWRSAAQPGRVLPMSILLIFAAYSLFEFPYWLMHFLVLNMVMLGAIDGGGVRWRMRFGKMFSAVLLLVFMVISVIYVPLVERFYWSYRQYLAREPVSADQYGFMNALVADPMMEPYGYLIYFANFEMSPNSLATEREVLERFRAYLPYAPIMARLAFVQFAMGDEAAGIQTVSDMRVFFEGGAEGYLSYQLKEAQHAFPGVDFSTLLKVGGGSQAEPHR